MLMSELQEPECLNGVCDECRAETLEIARATHTDDAIRAMYAVQNLASFFRDDCYSPEHGWVPRFHVRPTHAAIYTGSMAETMTHERDIPIEELDQFYEEAYARGKDVWDDYFHITYNSLTGAAEWVPGCGPAPVWSHPTAALTMTRDEMAATLDAWIKERW